MKWPSCTIFLFLLLIVLGCASGSAIVTGSKREPIDPQLVKLYLEEPKKYEVIGIVKASSDSGWTTQQDTDYAIAELKKQAAKLGANGVILLSSGEKSSEAVGFYGGSGLMYIYRCI